VADAATYDEGFSDGGWGAEDGEKGFVAEEDGEGAEDEAGVGLKIMTVKQRRGKEFGAGEELGDSVEICGLREGSHSDFPNKKLVRFILESFGRRI
jgi:hypothetical protein